VTCKDALIPCAHAYMDVIGTTPGKEEVELRREQQPRVESGTETESEA